jgi:hypothetical protein
MVVVDANGRVVATRKIRKNSFWEKFPIPHRKLTNPWQHSGTGLSTEQPNNQLRFYVWKPLTYQRLN